MGDVASRRDLGLWAVTASAHLPKRKNSGFDARVLTTLAMHADTKTYQTWVGQRKIAECALGIDLHEVTDSHIRQVQRSLNFLEQQRLLSRRVHGHNLGDRRSTNIYTLGFAPFIPNGAVIDGVVVDGEIIDAEIVDA